MSRGVTGLLNTGVQTQPTTENRPKTTETRPSPLARRRNDNATRVRANRPNILSRAWNSRFCVGTGHFIQGALGFSAFRGAYNRASGNTENTTKYLKTQYDAPKSNYSTRSDTTRTKEQARWAGHGATAGIATSAVVGFVPSIVGGILGGICGGVVRLFKGAPLAGKQPLREVRGDGKPEDWGKNLLKGFQEASKRVAHIISAKTDNIEQGLQMSRRPPAETRFAKYSGDRLPAKESVRLYQAYSELGFDKYFCAENQDFLLAVQLLEQHPTKENFDFICNNFIVNGGEQQVNLDKDARKDLEKLMELRFSQTEDGEDKWHLQDNVYKNLEAAVQGGVDSSEFKQLPKWLQKSLTRGMEARNSDKLSMADLFYASYEKICLLTKNDTFKVLAKDVAQPTS